MKIKKNLDKPERVLRITAILILLSIIALTFTKQAYAWDWSGIIDGDSAGMWFWLVVGGLAGTVLMDITAIAAERLNITSGGRCGGPLVIGRWVFGLFGGRLIHKNIIDSSPVKYEVPAGWIFHYLTGVGLVLTYPLFFYALDIPMPADQLIPSVVWGLVTSLLPWLILYPGYGWGLFGLRAPKNASPLIATPVAHMLYGLGMGIVLNMTSL